VGKAIGDADTTFITTKTSEQNRQTCRAFLPKKHCRYAKAAPSLRRKHRKVAQAKSGTRTQAYSIIVLKSSIKHNLFTMFPLYS